ncbi:MAG: DUF29 domain-containing protein [Merismopedia sp. SIO2A8]|nr:DUF29 domain-containing protein [Merismopedia sp. SIO2A8]
MLKNQQWDLLDRQNLIEEIESLGRQQRRELRNRLAILLGHLLKWHYQSDRRSRSWLATLRVQRREIQSLIQDNPSLKPYLDEALREGYLNGRDLAMGETNLPLSTFPETCIYSLTDVLNLDFYPGSPSTLTQELPNELTDDGSN